jgi:hypothetical protein
MAKSPAVHLDFKRLQDQVQRQFSNLDPNDPSQWPTLPRNLLFIAVCVVVVACSGTPGSASRLKVSSPKRREKSSCDRLPQEAGAGGQP